jgi:cytosine/adenosine deaminase-related metal-dependent hydrolase
MSSREALELATRGGADILGRPECGRLATGKRADIAIWDVSGLESAGSWDPAAILLAGPTKVKNLIVEGNLIVEDGQLLTTDLANLINLQNKLAKALA